MLTESERLTIGSAAKRETQQKFEGRKRGSGDVAGHPVRGAALLMENRTRGDKFAQVGEEKSSISGPQKCEKKFAFRGEEEW